MEGPILATKAWLFSLIAVFVYRRWFERVAAPDRDFEAFARSRPLLAAIRCRGDAVQRVLSALERRLGRKMAAVATLGGWPWPNYALTLEIDARSEATVYVYAVAARLLRTREVAPPALTTALSELALELENAISDVWVKADLRYVLPSKRPARGGWRVLARIDKPVLEPLDASPDWLAASPVVLPLAA